MIKMIDFHSHILPGIDDGAAGIDESIEMLKMEEEQGVEIVVLTPHFNPKNSNIESFLKERNRAFYQLTSAYSGKISFYSGAEVMYFNGISKCRDLSDLCIAETNTILIEMPFSDWSPFIIDEIISIKNSGFNVVLAHIERYMVRANKKKIQILVDNGIFIQSNIEFFIRKKSKALKMLKLNSIHVIGSDCHNLENRKPNFDAIKSILNNKQQEYLSSNSKSLLCKNRVMTLVEMI